MGLSIESSRPLVSGTFGTQYVSLMLIILTALVAIWVGAGGSFESSIHHAVSIQERETLVDAAVDTDDLQHIAPIGEIQFKRFFAPGGTQLNEDRSHALLEVLRTHDLIAHIDVANDVDQ